MAATSIDDFVDKMYEQINKISKIINEPGLSDSNKRLFIIDNKLTIEKIESNIDKVINEFTGKGCSNEGIVKLQNLKKSFIKSKNDIYNSLLSLSSDDNVDNVDKKVVNSNSNISKVKYHVIIKGVLTIIDGTKEEVNAFLNEQLETGECEIKDIIVIKGGEVSTLKTKIAI